MHHCTIINSTFQQVVAGFHQPRQGGRFVRMDQDVWLEAARLEKPANAKAVLAKAREGGSGKDLKELCD